MIVFDLRCRVSEHRFEAWFRSNADFERQREQGLVQCPFCQSCQIAKAPMAPRIRSSSTSEGLAELATLQSELLRESRWVGEGFAGIARAMHLGEIAQSPVHGHATWDEARSLVDEGIPIAPLPLPIVPPDQVN